MYSKDIGVYNLYISDFFISVTLGQVVNELRRDYDEYRII